MSPYYDSGIAVLAAFDEPDGTITGLSFGNVDVNIIGDEDADPVITADVLEPGVLYADPPVEYFDFPSDVFEDDGSYTIKAWAEDDDGTRISPVGSVGISVREDDSVNNSSYNGYGLVSAGTGTRERAWGAAGDAGLVLSVYGLSIQDE